MRHGHGNRKLNRSSSHRRALMRNMVTSLIKDERCTTTLAKAKEIRRVAEKVITIAGEDTLHRRRKAYGYLFDKGVVHKLFSEVGPRFKDRPGGYTRILRIGRRGPAADAAEMAVIELVQDSMKTPKKKTRGVKKKASGQEGAQNEKRAAQAETSSDEVKSPDVVPAQGAETGSEE